jgi:hypothetical protein
LPAQALVAGYAARYERPPLPEPPRHIETPRPGELFGLDCFYSGALVPKLTALERDLTRYLDVVPPCEHG